MAAIRTLLVTGGTGQVGTALQRVAGEVGGWRIVAPGRQVLDLAGADDPDPHLDGVDLAINAGAHTKVDQAEDEPDAAFAANRDGPARLAAACAARDVPLIQVSTDYVFDGSGDRPYREDDPIAPLGVYGASKAAGESAVREALAGHVILRTAWVFSPDGANFLKTMLRLGASREELGIVADQQGGPTEAGDIAHALLTIADSLLRAPPAAGDRRLGTFHFAGAPQTTWHGFAAEIFARAAARGLKVPRLKAIATADYPTKAKRPAWSVLDCSRIAEVYGIAQPDWRAGIDRCLDRLATG